MAEFIKDNTRPKRPVCSWCKHEILEDSINVPIQAAHPHENIWICYECAKKIYFDKNIRKSRELYRKHRLMNGIKKERLTPSYIKRYLDQYIIGQDKAKETLAVAVYNHYKTLRLKKELEGDQAEIDKSNVFLVGPTGAGKTAILKVLAKLLNVPFAIVDATSLTESGWNYRTAA